MKALSIRQPWAWLILHAGKDIENRVWRSHYRGSFYIHASKGMTRNEYADAFDFLDEIDISGRIAIPTFEELKRGGIVGKAEIVGCIEQSSSPWFCGPFGFVIANPIELKFTPCTGAQGFFEIL